MKGMSCSRSINALTEPELKGFLAYVGGDRADELAREYDAENMSPGELQHAISTDLFMAYGKRQWASYHADAGRETYLYFMDHVPPSFHIYMPDQPFLELEGGPRSGGAYHSGDLAYVFGSLDKVGYDWNEADRRGIRSDRGPLDAIAEDRKPQHRRFIGLEGIQY